MRRRGARVHAPIPEGYRGDFGPRLTPFVAELRGLGMPLEKIAERLRMRYDLEVSVATLMTMEEGVAESRGPVYRDLADRDRPPPPSGSGREGGGGDVGGF